VHFYHNGESVEKVKELVDVLGGQLALVNFRDIQNEIIKNVKAEDRMIVYRRYMMRILEKIGKKENAKAIVAGDSVGQVASQTLENIGLIYGASELPVLSPLIGMNKEEIVDIAKKIGTFDLSIKPGEDCCSFMIAEHPTTKGDLDKIISAEKGIDDGLVEKAVDNVEIING